MISVLPLSKWECLLQLFCPIPPLYRECAYEELLIFFSLYVATTRLVISSLGERTVLSPETQDCALVAVNGRYSGWKTEIDI